MIHRRWSHLIVFMLSLCVALGGSITRVAAADKDQITIADGRISMRVPEGWVRKDPRVRFIEHEFAIPRVGDDKTDGRVTVMGAGGSVEQNTDRWIGQFTQPDGKSTKDRAVVKQLKIANQQVHIVDVSGTFKDQRGPFAPATMHDNYRMLGAIIVTQGLGQYFVKLYGPKDTIAANEGKFKDVLNSLKVE